VTCLLASPPVYSAPTILTTGLLIGSIALAAVIGGGVARWVRLPMVLGYIGGGVVLRFLIGATITAAPEVKAAAEQPLDLVVSLGLGLILFTIGGVFEARAVRRVSGVLWRVAACEIGLTFALVFGFVWSAALLGASRHAGTGELAAFALLLACGSIATAPAATIFVLREYQAKGRVSETTMGLVGVNNVLAIVLFQAAFVLLAAGGAIQTSGLTGRAVWLEVGYAVCGSIAAGTVVGVLMAVVHARVRPGESFFVLIGVTLLLEGGAHWLTATNGFADILLLSMLVAGAVFSNSAVDPERLNETVRTLAAPVFVGFFVVAGYRLHVEELPHLGLIGSAYILARGAGKVCGAWLGVRWIGRKTLLRGYVGAGMLCQAAVIIGLAEFVRANWHHEWLARSFVTTVFGSVVVFELVGPVLLKAVVVRAGEVKVDTLLRRTSTPVTTALRVALGSLFRSVGFGGVRGRGSGSELTVRHVMRANVETLPASAPFDEVLHFVERSRLNDFPVVDEQGGLVGVIHLSDLRRVIYDPDLRALVTAADLVASDIHLIEPNTPLAEALAAFRNCEARALPVAESAESRRVIGVVEERDVHRAMHG